MATRAHRSGSHRAADYNTNHNKATDKMNQEDKLNAGHSVLDGTNLILSVDGKALGFSTRCKISTSAETGERITKEAVSGKWKEKYVKSFSEQVTADGCILTDGDSELPTYDELRDMMLKGEPVEARYSLREGDTRAGKTASGYGGKYIITQLDADGQAGDDGKYSINLQNCGKVKKIGTGLTEEKQTDDNNGITD